MAFASAKASLIGILWVVLRSKIAAAKQRKPQKPGVKKYFSRYSPNSSAVFFMRSAIFTSKGQRVSQEPQATHAPAWLVS